MHHLYVYAASQILVFIFKKRWILKHMNIRLHISYLEQKKLWRASENEKGCGQKSWIFPHAGNDIKWKYMPSRSRIWCPFVYIWSFFYRCFPAPNTYVWALDLGTPPWETPIKKGSDIDKRTSDSWSTRHVLSFYIISSVRKNPWFLTTSFLLVVNSIV